MTWDIFITILFIIGAFLLWMYAADLMSLLVIPEIRW